MFLNSNGRTQKVLSAILSLVIASALWYFVVGRDHVEMQIEIRVEYHGLSDSLTVLDGNVGHVTARLRGSEELLKSLLPGSMSYTVDLSTVHQGANQITLDIGSLPVLRDRGLEILQVTPSQIVLQIDNVITRNIRVRPRLLPLPKDSPFMLQSAEAVSEPSMVAVRGPESMMTPIEELVTAPIDPMKNAREGVHEVQAAINAPAMLEVSKPVVSVRYSLMMKTMTINRDLPLVLENGSTAEFELASSKLNVNIDIPTDHADDIVYAMKEARAVVKVPETMLPGESLRLPVSFAGLPPRAVISSGSSSTVQVTRRKKAHADKKTAQHVSPPAFFSYPYSDMALSLPGLQDTGPFAKTYPFAQHPFSLIPWQNPFQWDTLAPRTDTSLKSTPPHLSPYAIPNRSLETDSAPDTPAADGEKNNLKQD